jgi:predicted MFS family arabinose efflux permease
MLNNGIRHVLDVALSIAIRFSHPATWLPVVEHELTVPTGFSGEAISTGRGRVATRYVSHRAVLSIGLSLVGLAMAPLTLFRPSTCYPYLAADLLVLGVGLGLAFAMVSDVVLAGVRPERAGAAAAMSETGYELGMALGIAMIGSIVAGRTTL